MVSPTSCLSSLSLATVPKVQSKIVSFLKCIFLLAGFPSEKDKWDLFTVLKVRGLTPATNYWGFFLAIQGLGEDAL